MFKKTAIATSLALALGIAPFAWADEEMTRSQAGDVWEEILNVDPESDPNYGYAPPKGFAGNETFTWNSLAHWVNYYDKMFMNQDGCLTGGKVWEINVCHAVAAGIPGFSPKPDPQAAVSNEALRDAANALK